MKDGYHKMLEGYRKFKQARLSGGRDVFDLDFTQTPQVLVISCCDSRVVPNFILGAAAGEIFAIRNIANIVPPYDEHHSTYHGTSAAIEYAVLSLKVKHIIILGHTKCGGIEAMLKGGLEQSTDFVGKWMEIVKPAFESVADKNNLSFEEKCEHCERESLKISLANLKTFPFIQKAISAKTLALHAMVFDISTCALHRYNETTNIFEEVK